MLNKKRVVSIKRLFILLIVLLLLFILTVNSQSDVSSVSKRTYNLSHRIQPWERNGVQINESEFYKDRKRTFEVYTPGKTFNSEKLAPIQFQNLAISNNLTDNFSFGFIQFDTIDGDPKHEQMDILAREGVQLYEYHGDHTYYAKFPKSFFEKPLYNFIYWVGFENEPSSKYTEQFKKYTDGIGDDNINISVSLFEKPSDIQLDQLLNLNVTIFVVGNPSEMAPMIMQINKSKLNDLAGLNFVKKIELRVLPKSTLDKSQGVVSADFVWGQGNTASGVTVGVIDTGIQHLHPHFSSITIYDARDYAQGDNNPEALCGENNCSNNIDDNSNGLIDEGAHGTHVAGIISGSSNLDGRGIRGISSNANLVIQRTLNSLEEYPPPSVAPPPSLPDIWKNIIDPDNDTDVLEPNSSDLISNSWEDLGAAFDGIYDDDSTQVDRTVLGLNGKAVPVIFAAGNEYQDGPSFIHVDPPATAKNAITVGASGDFVASNLTSPRNWLTDSSNLLLMEYSERNTSDNRMKPDILAPGSSITSSIMGSAYGAKEGTSMAVPHVSAVAAQLLNNINLTPYAVKAFIIGNSINGSRTNNYPKMMNINQGWGRLDAAKTVYQVQGENFDGYDIFHVGEPGSGLNQEIQYNVVVPINSDRLLATLVWDDLPGQRNSSQTLYNDLDLFITFPNGSTDLPTKEDDTINNVEKYIYDNPVNGTWTVHVRSIDLNGTSGTQNYSIVMIVDKKTTTVHMSADLWLVNSTVKPGGTTQLYTETTVSGLMGTDLKSVVAIPSGVTVTSGAVDGSDENKDMVGDLVEFERRFTRNITVRGDTIGTKRFDLYINGTAINGQKIFDSSTKNLNVCYDDDNDGYFLNSCGGNDCNDNNANINPGATEICDGVDNNCNGIIDEVCTPLGLTILYPVNNIKYQSTTLALNWTTNNTLASCYYKLDESNYSNIICSANYSYSGFSFSVSGQDTSPQDVTRKGNNYYMVGSFNEAVYEYSSSGTYTGTSFSVSGQDVTPLGITWNGSRFYVTNNKL